MASMMGEFAGAATASYFNTRKRARADEVVDGPTAGGGPAGQLVKATSVYGRPRGNYRTKLNRISFSHHTTFFQGLKPFGSTGTGVLDANNLRFFPCAYQEPNPLGTSDIRCPLYLIDLTQKTENINNEVCCHRLVQLGAAPNNFDFQTIAGVQEDGTSATNNWRLFRSNGQARDLITTEKAVLRDVSADFLFQGCQGINSWFEVSLVQILDASLLPTVTSNAEANKFWEHMVKPCVGHPFASVPKDLASSRGRVKVLKRYRYSIAPDSTTNEATTTPGQVMAKIKFNLNRLCDFEWIRKAPQDTYGLVNEPNTFKPIYEEVAPGDSGYSYLPNFRARVFLMIRAGAYNSINSTDYSYDSRSIPSFDMRLFGHWITKDGMGINAA